MEDGAMRETWIPSLGQEDPLEKEMATLSSILAWRIPWTEEPGELQSMGLQRVRHDLATKQQQQQQINFLGLPCSFPVAQVVKDLSVRQETRIQSLGWEVPLEKRMATHSSILAWRIPWTEKPGRLQSVGSQRVRHN